MLSGPSPAEYNLLLHPHHHHMAISFPRISSESPSFLMASSFLSPQPKGSEAALCPRGSQYTWSKIQIPGWLSISSGPNLTVPSIYQQVPFRLCCPHTLPQNLCAPFPEHPETDSPALSQPLLATDLTQASPLVASLPLICMSRVFFLIILQHTAWPVALSFSLLGAHSVRRGVLSTRARLCSRHLQGMNLDRHSTPTVLG